MTQGVEGPWCGVVIRDGREHAAEAAGFAAEFGDGACVALLGDDPGNVHVFPTRASMLAELAEGVTVAWLEQRDGAPDLGGEALAPTRPFQGPWRGRVAEEPFAGEVVRFVYGDLTVVRCGAAWVVRNDAGTYVIGGAPALRRAPDAPVAWTDPLPTPAFERGGEECEQDAMENAPFASIGGRAARDAPRVPAYIAAGDAAEWLRGYTAMARWLYGNDWQTCAFGWRFAGDLSPSQRAMTLPLSRRAIRRAAFVDFNGVLDGDAWAGRHAHTNRLSPVHVARLDALCRDTGAAVVVASAWRCFTPRMELRDILTRAGFAAPVVIDALGFDRGDDDRRVPHAEPWLDAHPWVEAWVALDDEVPYVGPRWEGRFVRVDGAAGLTDADVARARGALETPWRA